WHSIIVADAVDANVRRAAIGLKLTGPEQFDSLAVVVERAGVGAKYLCAGRNGVGIDARCEFPRVIRIEVYHQQITTGGKPDTGGKQKFDCVCQLPRSARPGRIVESDLLVGDIVQ